MTRRSRFVHNLYRPSCFHRLRISLFFSSTRSSYPCLRVAVRYKSGWICAQLPIFRSPFPSSPIFLLFTSDVLSLLSHLALFFSSTRSSFTFLQVAVSYKPGRICAQLPLSVLQFHLRRSHYSSIPPFCHRLRISLFFLVDFLFHYGILSSFLPSVHQRPFVFVCFRKLSRAP